MILRYHIDFWIIVLGTLVLVLLLAHRFDELNTRIKRIESKLGITSVETR